MSAKDSLMDTAAENSLLDKQPGSVVEGSIYLMRHGSTVLDAGDNRSDGFLDFPLSDKGRLGVIDAQQALKVVPLSCIYAADLKRTQETAEIIQSGTMSKPDIEAAPEARTWNLGVLSGLKKSEGRPKVKILKANPSRQPLGGESFNEFKARFLPWFNEQLEEVEENGKPILLVLSGSNLRLIGVEMFNDESALDLDEGGLAVLHNIVHSKSNQWHVQVLLGHEDASPYES